MTPHLFDCTLVQPPASLFPPVQTRVRSLVGGFGFVVGYDEDWRGASLMVVRLISGEYVATREAGFFEIWSPPSRVAECDRATVLESWLEKTRHSSRFLLAI